MRMFGAVYRFELRYHLTRPITGVYFALFAVGAFAWMSTDTIALAGGAGQVMRNAPWVIVNSMLLVVMLGQIVVAGLVGNSVLRDYQVRAHELVFTTTITRFAFLGGRFLGAFTVMVIVHLGMIVGLALGAAMPWMDQARVLPFDLAAYVVPFVVLVLPALLVISSIFLAVGALTRNAFAVHTQGIILLVAWSVAQTLVGNINSRTIAALLDPIGMSAFATVTRYWSVAEKNTMGVSLGGVLLANRILWTVMALGVAGLTGLLFRFRSAPPSLRRGRQLVEEHTTPAAPARVITAAVLQFGLRAWWVHWVSSTRTSFLSIVRQLPFTVIVAVGLINLAIAASNVEVVFGQHAWPLTYSVAEVLNRQFNLYFIVLITLYAGELVWRERELGADQVVDALPASTSATMLGNVTALVMAELVILLVLMGAGMLFQGINGYYRFEPVLYLSYLLGTVLPALVQLTVLAVTIHVLVNQKYLGYALVILAFILRRLAPNLGLEHPLFQFATTAPFTYSDMNGYGPYVPSLVWSAVYWSAVAVLLGVLAYLAWIRGSEAAGRTRRRAALQRWRGTTRAVTAGGFAVAVAAGGVIYHNANVVNEYQNAASLRRLKGDYERTYKPLARLPQPRLIAADVRLDLEPERGAFAVSGTFTYVNNHAAPLESLVVVAAKHDVRVDSLHWDRPTTSLVQDTRQGVRMYRLKTALAPNDTVRLRYRGHYASRGFPVGGPDTALALIGVRNAVSANGSFVNYEYFPFLGYLTQLELTSDDSRRQEGLPPKVRMAPLDDVAARAVTYMGFNADWIDFRATVSTSPDQIAIAPGHLTREYQEGGRRVFEYRAREPMLAFFTFLSARYEVRRENWKDVALEIYYHKGHEFNVDRMFASMKSSLEDYSSRFSPYQFKQLRIVEFPRYSTFAQAFPGTVPFSESVGFILRAGTNVDDIDTPFYVTAHEVAHQWWFHQVVGGNVQGATVLSEALANYSAMLVMEQAFGRDNIRKFLRSQLDGYLTGRSRESKAERPLMLVENQPYIHYNKGSLALYALRDLIGDAAMNRALKRFVADKAFQKPPFTTSRELLGYLDAETPDSLRYAVDDLFRTITLWDNSVENASVSKRADGSYDVAVHLRTGKLRSDSLGNEQPTPMHDLVDIGVFGAVDSTYALGKPLYLAKHRISAGDTTVHVIVRSPPRSVGIDPYNKLIDRKPRDNVMNVKVP